MYIRQLNIPGNTTNTYKYFLQNIYHTRAPSTRTIEKYDKGQVTEIVPHPKKGKLKIYVYF